MHRTLNALVRGLVQDCPEEWESSLMYAHMLLRSAPMGCLGGRSPYEVVTGLKPRMPRCVSAGAPVEARGVDDYVR